ncbi:MAG: TonB-dependent receptor, partial [bacterium]|nr:TonB-dependent receptor [bacterium]
GEVLPGATVSLSSNTVIGANRVTVTNAEGQYRFVGLQPGTYTVTAELEGFDPEKKPGIRVNTGKTVTLDFSLKLSTVKVNVVVQGKAPVVDIKDSSTATLDLSSEYLRNMPNHRQFVPEVVNMAPGIDRDVAYGSAEASGILYMVDGVDVSDPDAGTAWVFLDYNAVESMSVTGLGAPAEYGGFSGAIFNTVTKSGTNKFKGYTELFFQDKSWNSENSSDVNVKAGPLGIYNAHISVGGPIIQDKLSFFASLLYYRQQETYPGTTYDEDFEQPKFFLKFSWQPTAKTRINTFLTVDAYDGTGREGGLLNT